MAKKTRRASERSAHPSAGRISHKSTKAATRTARRPAATSSVATAAAAAAAASDQQPSTFYESSPANHYRTPQQTKILEKVFARTKGICPHGDTLEQLASILELRPADIKAWFKQAEKDSGKHSKPRLPRKPSTRSAMNQRQSPHTPLVPPDPTDATTLDPASPLSTISETSAGGYTDEPIARASSALDSGTRLPPSLTPSPTSKRPSSSRKPGAGRADTAYSPEPAPKKRRVSSPLPLPLPLPLTLEPSSIQNDSSEHQAATAPRRSSRLRQPSQPAHPLPSGQKDAAALSSRSTRSSAAKQSLVAAAAAAAASPRRTSSRSLTPTLAAEARLSTLQNLTHASALLSSYYELFRGMRSGPTERRWTHHDISVDAGSRSQAPMSSESRISTDVSESTPADASTTEIGLQPGSQSLSDAGSQPQCEGFAGPPEHTKNIFSFGMSHQPLKASESVVAPKQRGSSIDLSQHGASDQDDDLLETLFASIRSRMRAKDEKLHAQESACSELADELAKLRSELTQCRRQLYQASDSNHALQIVVSEKDKTISQLVEENHMLKSQTAALPEQPVQNAPSGNTSAETIAAYAHDTRPSKILVDRNAAPDKPHGSIHRPFFEKSREHIPETSWGELRDSTEFPRSLSASSVGSPLHNALPPSRSEWRSRYSEESPIEELRGYGYPFKRGELPAGIPSAQYAGASVPRMHGHGHGHSISESSFQDTDRRGQAPATRLPPRTQ
ncbi:uncharacterized protein BJ171DRAFT_505895 [Polychytrium aggregatum]|uniref:uncharacterized protein n=1 Tax=Polychytrium aggregatum TaxID=110093 RepID=UPI0022FE8FA4|nr:uncharacterized protein BJ171DRAFT_505895 [Polychytrium aggregatum]KAI9204471.1 hypothetical protein BJ171DRAFT_505895 [Polychytrium aggregatum]